MNEQPFSEKDLYCIARLIQNSFQAPEQKNIDNTYRPLYGCLYCKYAIPDCGQLEKIHFLKVFKKLEKLTGVSLSTYVPEMEQLGHIFLPASHYLEYPEDIHYLERVHDLNTVENIKGYLHKVISRSKEMSDQKQDTPNPDGSHDHTHICN